MASLSELRAKYPQYNDMSDGQFADAFHRKFYSDLPREQFNAKIGFSSNSAASPRAAVSIGQVEVPQYDAMGNAVGGTETVPVSDMSYGEQMGNVGRVTDNAMRLAANGLTANLADKAAGGIDALTGQAGSYDEGVRAQRGRTQDIRDANPGLALAAEAAGGVVGGAGLIKNGVTLASRFGPGILPRIASFGAEGAAYGGAYGAGGTYSEDPMDYARNAGEGAAYGGIVGTGLPVAGSLAGGAYRAVKAATGPSVGGSSYGASTLLRGAAQADEAGLRALPSMGDEAMLVDAGPSMLGLGQGAATGTGPGRSQLVTALRERDAGTGPRLSKTLDAQLGPAPIPSRIEASIEANQRALSPAYQAVFRDARRVDTTPIAEGLESQIVNLRGDAQKAAQKVRRMLNVNGADALDPNPFTLFQVRNEIDDMLGSANVGKHEATVLSEARKQVDQTLAGSVPGLKEVDAQFAELARQNKGLARGSQVFDTGKTTPRPQELAEELQQGALPQGQQIGPSAVPYRVRQGSRAEIDRLVGTNINDLNTLERTLATPQDWNFQKMGTVFGDAPRDRIASELLTNRNFRNSYQTIAQGSQTAQRSAAAKSLDEAGSIPMDTTVTGATMNTAARIAKAILGASKESTKDEVGKLLSKQGDTVRTLVEALLSQAQTARTGANVIRAGIANPLYLAPAGQYGGRR